MTDSTTDRYSAGEQGLGYIYQARLALQQIPWSGGFPTVPDDDLTGGVQFEGLGTTEAPSSRPAAEREGGIPVFRNQQEFAQWYQNGGRGEYRWKNDRETHFAR